MVQCVGQFEHARSTAFQSDLERKENTPQLLTRHATHGAQHLTHAENEQNGLLMIAGV